MYTYPQINRHNERPHDHPPQAINRLQEIHRKGCVLGQNHLPDLQSKHQKHNPSQDDN